MPTPPHRRPSPPLSPASHLFWPTSSLHRHNPSEHSLERRRPATSHNHNHHHHHHNHNHHQQKRPLRSLPHRTASVPPRICWAPSAVCRFCSWVGLQSVVARGTWRTPLSCIRHSREGGGRCAGTEGMPPIANLLSTRWTLTGQPSPSPHRSVRSWCGTSARTCRCSRRGASTCASTPTHSTSTPNEWPSFKSYHKPSRIGCWCSSLLSSSLQHWSSAPHSTSACARQRGQGETAHAHTVVLPAARAGATVRRSGTTALTTHTTETDTTQSARAATRAARA
mmetsp:Transcript_4878/g.11324  ORF Transcript_4878/g.11324 Transcript_4878/m.11324 type:complete len:281 (-) Transcript_4878:940-1782(-)